MQGMSIEAIPAQTALARALEIVMTNCIQGGQYDADNLTVPIVEKRMSFYIEFERGWAINCTLSVNLAWTAEEVPCKAKVDVAWPSSTYSVAAAQAAIALHQEVVNLAALVQATLDEMNIMSIRASLP